jgi:hypothetical protein
MQSKLLPFVKKTEIIDRHEREVHQLTGDGFDREKVNPPRSFLDLGTTTWIEVTE